MTFHANIVDVFGETIREGRIEVRDGKIAEVLELSTQPNPALPYITPGFVDAHVHIESSMLVPSEFARLAVIHGTVATVSDPHEIANVCGMEGVDYMIANGKSVNFNFYFGAPSCVPATSFETAGDQIDAAQIASLLQRPDVHYLSEVMNYPGVINEDREVMTKIAAARAAGKPVDGHAPGLSGDDLRRYIAAGISTDHECVTEAEAREKLRLGMKILIREGSAAKNFDALIDMLPEFRDQVMFCSDDKHPDSLLAGHINELCRRAVARDISVFDVLRAACINPVLHYRLHVGMLRPQDAADFIILRNLTDFTVLETWINGVCVATNGRTTIASQPVPLINRFHATTIHEQQLRCYASSVLRDGMLPVIGARDGQLITDAVMTNPVIEADIVTPDLSHDILKIVVVNRYEQASPAVSFIQSTGLQRGAIASSVAHDSHNIVVMGVDDCSICLAANAVIANKGGIACVGHDGKVDVLPLPVAGLMSDRQGTEVAAAYIKMDQRAKQNGCTLSAPFMTLSFMALLVIPSLKLSDKGLFDGRAFRFV